MSHMPYSNSQSTNSTSSGNTANSNAKPLHKPAGASGRPGAPDEGYRLKTPRSDKNQIFGVVEELFGGSRMKVRCEDGKTRTCTVRGKMRRRFWIKRGDIVILELWTAFQSDDSKASIVWRYTETQALKLRRRGLLSKLEKREETEIII